jgi:hypothetical protein
MPTMFEFLLLFDVLIKPVHRLQECLLFGVLCAWFANVCTNSKAMRNIRVEEELIRHVFLGEYLFRLVTFLGSEYVVRFCSCIVRTPGIAVSTISQ